MTVVCIAGMHRSGASLVTRLLNTCGMHLGPRADVRAPISTNPDECWENARFVELNEALLAELGGGWDYPPRTGRQWLETDTLAHWHRQASSLVGDFQNSEFWGWNDPRNSILAPFWLAVRPDLKFVVCLRHPLEVADSLGWRNDFSVARSLSLWREYNARLLAATTPRQRIITHYEAYLVDWPAELVRVLEFLKTTLPSEVRERCASVLRGGLRRNRTAARQLSDAFALPPEVLELYTVMCREAGWHAGRADWNLEEHLPESKAAGGHTHVHDFHLARLEGELDNRDLELARLENELQIRERELTQLGARAEALGADIAQLETAAQERAARAATQATELDAQTVRVARSEAELHLLEQNLATVLQSRSWRMTATLRGLPRPRFACRALKLMHWLVTLQLVDRLRDWPRRSVAVPEPDSGPVDNVLDADRQVAYDLIQASGLFDTKFYLASNSGIAEAGIDALTHYLTTGAAEGRDPHPLFDTSFYTEGNPAVSLAGIDPLHHYLTVGAAAGCDPNPYFDTSLYAIDFHGALPALTTPLAHFVSEPAVAAGLRRTWKSNDLQLGWTDYARQFVQSTFCYTAQRKGIYVHDAAGNDLFAPGVIVVAQDALPGQQQLIALSVVRTLVDAREFGVCVLLRRGGPLVQQFLASAPTVVLESDSVQTQVFDGALNELLTCLRRRGFDAAICNGVVTGDIAERLKSSGVRVVTTIDGLPTSVSEPDLLRRVRQAYSHSDDVVFSTSFIQQRTALAFSLVPRSASVRSPGIVQPNPFVNERTFARLQITKQLAIPTRASIVIGFGQGAQRNGSDLFIQMARLITQRTNARETHFVWIGEQDMDRITECLEEAARCGLSERVHIPGAGQVSELLYAAGDVFVLPSREDPFPTACLLAMEAGLPVVAFDAPGGIDDVIRDDAGILVPYLDSQAMATAVGGLLDDPGRSQRLGARAQRRIREDFQLSRYVNFLVGRMYPAARLTGHADAGSPHLDQLIARAHAR
jgi:glycosyltransferase involved in cell wall biosynthesis